MAELIYKILSYKLVGLAYKIDKELGFGHKERTYSIAFEELLKDAGILYKKEVYFPIKINDKVVEKKFFDFLIDDKIIIEFKTGKVQYKQVFAQLFQYLKLKDLKLGLIIRFRQEGVEVKRVLNIRN